MVLHCPALVYKSAAVILLPHMLLSPAQAYPDTNQQDNQHGCHNIFCHYNFLSFAPKRATLTHMITSEVSRNRYAIIQIATPMPKPKAYSIES